MDLKADCFSIHYIHKSSCDRKHTHTHIIYISQKQYRCLILSIQFNLNFSSEFIKMQKT